MQEIKATQQEEIQKAVSKITEEHQRDYIHNQGQAIELKTSMNSVLAMTEQFETVVQQSNIRYEQLADKILIQESNQTAHQAELQRLQEQHATAMAKAQQELSTQHDMKVKQQEETFQEQIKTLSEEMQQIKQMFANMAIQQPTTVQNAPNTNETPPRDNERQRPSATPPGPTTDLNQEAMNANDMDHQPVEDDEILAPSTLQYTEDNESQPPEPATLLQNPANAHDIDPSIATSLSNPKEYDKHGT